MKVVLRNVQLEADISRDTAGYKREKLARFGPRAKKNQFRSERSRIRGPEGVVRHVSLIRKRSPIYGEDTGEQRERERERERETKRELP